MQSPEKLTLLEIGLNAVIVAVESPTPWVLTVVSDTADEPEALPFGPFDPLNHRTFEIGLKAWVEDQTALRLGHIEQLYTFGDRGRHMLDGDKGPHVVSVGYLALTRKSIESEETLALQGSRWQSWYDYFPWEDWRDGRPEMLDEQILPTLQEWAATPPPPGRPSRALSRSEQIRLAFGQQDNDPWDEEKVLDRYELLYEAGLVLEAARDGREEALKRAAIPAFGQPMRFDHRRILATAISRLRAKLKYRPVVFELMTRSFTLTELQQTVQAISGRHLHKQNFRRLVEAGELVEPTGEISTATGGRPAALFRFRRNVLKERPTLGLKVGGR